MDMKKMSQDCKRASIMLAALEAEKKNTALAQIAEALGESKPDICRANMLDLAEGKKAGLKEPILKRLKFDEQKIDAVIDGINSLIKLPDPVGKILEARELDKGLILNKVSCPIGVLGVIFESRPDALVQISALCLKSGNGVLLKGGSEAKETNRILSEIIAATAKSAGVPDGWIQLLETRADVNEMLKMNDYIDLIIPRGSNEFVRYIIENSAIPVLGHADGICHCYIDEFADSDMAVKIVVDSKTQYVSVCNAVETLLVHSSIAGKILPLIKAEFDKKGVAIYGCGRTRDYISAETADENSWKTEYLDYMMSVKVVDSLDEAIEHINRYGSRHTDTIVTENKQNAEMFMSLVDSANVFHNCSTRFSDGYRYGFGAEVGISTNKIHARGPVGLEGLAIYKYKLYGTGQTVDEYSAGRKQFTHRDLDKNCTD
ncbi:MAG: glutamate-5-semialdehyde dehydrogenase [Eubacteriales bacterium]|nr:glutamate-5-semialdehyde dehydrogenase [Eubacteriales bacterium]